MPHDDHTTTTTTTTTTAATSVATTPTDPWGRPIIDGQARFGPLDGDDTRWPAVPMTVDDDADVVDCAAGFARAFSSEYYFTVWLIVIGRDGRSTHEVVELLDMPPRPPEHGIGHVITKAARQLPSLLSGASIVVAIATPDGGDRGAREMAWARSVMDAAEVCDVPVRGIVAVGARRARLLHGSTVGPQ